MFSSGMFPGAYILISSISPDWVDGSPVHFSVVRNCPIVTKMDNCGVGIMIPELPQSTIYDLKESK
jgi:hypothetical protein